MVARLWQRLAELLAAVAGWRFFKPAVFLACLPCRVRSWRSPTQVLTGRTGEALGVDPDQRRSSTKPGRTRSSPAHHALDHADPAALQSQSPPDRPPHAGRVGVHLRAPAPDDLSGVRSAAATRGRRATFARSGRTSSSVRSSSWGRSAFVILLALAVDLDERVGAAAEEELAAAPPARVRRRSAGIIHFIWIQKSDISEPRSWCGWRSCSAVRSCGCTSAPASVGAARVRAAVTA